MGARPLEQVGERGGGLAEAHVVGQTPAEAQAVQELEPAEGAPLIVTQRASEGC
jgi:hypothetical protein